MQLGNNRSPRYGCRWNFLIQQEGIWFIQLKKLAWDKVADMAQAMNGELI